MIIRRFIFSCIACSLFAAGILSAQEKTICVTFDDLPVVPPRMGSPAAEKRIVSVLTAALQAHAIPAIGFVNEGKLASNTMPDPARMRMLRTWLDAGLDLGNHTYAHSDFHKSGCEEFFKDILRGERIIGSLMAEYGKHSRYFRHPFLHIGETKEKADSLRMFLAGIEYSETPVTIDNADYIFSVAYDSACIAGDTTLMRTIGAVYIAHTEQKLRYYEGQTRKLFGRNIAQILLLHANAINADYLNALASMVEQNGYRFVPIGKALEDSVYITPVTVYRDWGISWLDRWALSMGKKGGFFKDEPAVPVRILHLAGMEKE